MNNNPPKLEVGSHWSTSHKVTLKFGDQSVTVDARELQRAVENCSDL